jgi:hypothetical protein
VSLSLKLNSQYDCFYFDSILENKITIPLPVTCVDLISYFQATLHSNKYVIISNSQWSADDAVVKLLKTSHFKIESNKFIFLNFTIKKQIEKIIDQNISFNTYQEVESFLELKLSSIF